MAGPAGITFVLAAISAGFETFLKKIQFFLDKWGWVYSVMSQGEILEASRCIGCCESGLFKLRTFKAGGYTARVVEHFALKARR